MLFRGEFWFLSNMFPCPIQYNGHVFGCVESAFQAQKCPERANDFEKLNGYAARRLGRTVKLTNDWDTNKIGIMYAILKVKFANPELAKKLLATCPQEIIEENNWGDTYWGVSHGIGENNLGKLLMKVRSEISSNDFKCISIALTGHRPSALPGIYGYNYHNMAWQTLGIAFEKVVKSIYKKYGAVTLYDGMALGVDQAMALKFLSIKEEIQGKLIASIPCQHQDRKWLDSSKKLYYEILSAADEKVLVTDGPYTPRCMQVRNEYMVDHADVVIAIWNGNQHGGTFNAVSYARQKHKPVIRIDPNTLEIRTIKD